MNEEQIREDLNKLISDNNEKKNAGNTHLIFSNDDELSDVLINLAHYQSMKDNQKTLKDRINLIHQLILELEETEKIIVNNLKQLNENQQQ